MARANLNKSLVNKYNRSINLQNQHQLEFPHSDQNFVKLFFYEVNIVSQYSHLHVLLLSKFGSEGGDFN